MSIAGGAGADTTVSGAANLDSGTYATLAYSAASESNWQLSIFSRSLVEPQVVLLPTFQVV